jgi:hypothetical protein
MSELHCYVVVEYSSSNDVKAVAEFPLRIHNIGACQILAQALQSKEFHQLVTRNRTKIPLRVFSGAKLKSKCVNGWAVGEQSYNALMRLKGFIAKNSGDRVRVYVHWVYDDQLLQENG